MEEVADITRWRRAERARLIGARLELAPEKRRQRSAAVEQRLATLLKRLGTRILGAYWPVKGEFDPLPLAGRLIAEGWRVALPAAIAKDSPLEYRAWQPGDAMENGRHGIPEPAQRALVTPEILLLPLVGFDDGLHRLGYGGGYFDRTLAALSPRPIAIGVGFEAQRLDTIHPRPHDLTLDAIVTEAQLREKAVK